jgi:hypothetical protein
MKVLLFSYYTLVFYLFFSIIREMFHSLDCSYNMYEMFYNMYEMFYDIVLIVHIL